MGHAAGVLEEHQVTGLGSVAAALVGGVAVVAGALELTDPLAAADFFPDVRIVAVVEPAQIPVSGLVGAVGLIQTPGYEAGAPGIVAAAVTQTQITQVVAVFHVVGASGNFSGEAAVGSTFLITQLTQSDGDQVGAVVAGDGYTLVIAVVHATGIGA